MSVFGTEQIEVLRAAVEFLQYTLHYDHAHQESENFLLERANEGEAILVPRLERQLRRLNPELSNAELRKAIDALTKTEHSSLPHLHRELHRKLTWRVFPGQETPDSSGPPLPRYFDFDSPDRNEFLAVERFRMLGASGPRQLDLVVFVNGIPLAVVVACPPGASESVAHGVHQLLQLQQPHEVPRLFHTVHFLIALQPHAARYGTVGTPGLHFRGWEDPAPLSWDDLRASLQQSRHRETILPTPSDILLTGLLARANLLDMLRNFTAFSLPGEEAGARVAWCHQYQAVMRACAKATGQGGRGGVIWHPVGTGKSLSLFWLACKLRHDPACQGHMLLLSDRAEVRQRLQAEFEANGWPLPRQAAPGTLASLLQRGGPATIIAGVEEVRTLAESHAGGAALQLPSSLQVLVEELHPPRYGTLATDLERLFPRAGVVAFTAFPPSFSSTGQMPEWGGVLHLYPHRQAEREGHILPAFFERRLPAWQIWGPTAEPHPGSGAGSGSVTAGAPWDRFDRKTLRAMLAENRIAAVAEDVWTHFNQEILPNGCQGILIAATPALAAGYYRELEARSPGRVAVLLPKPKRHKSELMQLYHKFEAAGEILARFARGPGDWDLLILVEPLPGGLAAPALQVVYLDHPLYGQELLRALAFTQRRHEAHKHYGLLVDYWGVTRHLAQALEGLAALPQDQLPKFRFAETQLEDLRLWRRELLRMFASYLERDSTEPWIMALAADTSRSAFRKSWQKFILLLDQLLPQSSNGHLLEDAHWLDLVRRDAAAFFYDDDLAAAECSPKLRKLLAEHAQTRTVRQVRERTTVYSSAFLEEVASLTSPEAKITRLEYALRHETAAAASADPVYYQGLTHRVERITLDWRHGRTDSDTALDRLQAEVTRLRAEKPGRATPGRQADQEAFLGVLQQFLAPTEADRFALREKHAEFARQLLAAITAETRVVDWTQKEDLQREMRRKLKHVLREIECPANLWEPLTAALMQLAHSRFGNR